MIPALRDGPGLKEDLQILLKFWSMMLSDKKYIKTQIVGGKSTFYSIKPPLVIVVPVMFELTLLIDATITIAANVIKSVPQ